MPYKIIVAHPGRQHSFRLASALKKNNMLLYYCTTIYDKESSFLMKVVKKFLSKDNLKRANGRKNADLKDESVIQYCEFLGIIEALLARMDKSHNWYRLLHEFVAYLFGKKVAKLAIRVKADAVIMYDSNSLYAFKYLKMFGPDIMRIQDVSIAARPYMRYIYQEEINRSGHDSLYIENQYLWNDSKIKNLQMEIDETQYFLVASEFVKESLKWCGAYDKQIKIVPYGANISSNIIRDSVSGDKAVEFLFVGQVIYRKGISYLLESAVSFPKNTIHVTVTGAYNDEDWFIQKYKNDERIEFTGLVTLDKMRQIYEKANVFVLPSFAEGMAQVGIEAMACGLPIICSDHTGVNDLVEDGKTGFVIPCGDLLTLKEKMQWFIDHRDKIVQMGEAAREAAEKYTWDYYEENVVAAVKSIMKEV